jgi:hypothetical protein
MCITVSVVSRQWDKVEDKYAVATIGVAAIVALWTVVGAIKVHDQDKAHTTCLFTSCSSFEFKYVKLQESSFLRAQAIDKIPLLPGVFEIVGIGYTGVSSQAFLLAETLFYVADEPLLSFINVWNVLMMQWFTYRNLVFQPDR